MREVLVRNDLGWTVQSLKSWKTETTGVVQVDARELLPNGLFKFAVLHFRADEDAEAFEQKAVRSADKMRASWPSSVSASSPSESIGTAA